VSTNEQREIKITEQKRCRLMTEIDVLSQGQLLNAQYIQRTNERVVTSLE
jgi:hypothetical protein